ncbi:MAG: hypothetical protein NTV02_02235 [Candidatus Zambryskibacteria bacterium]|nr:hypothetical protein [Candidatus Zambryskibacteria bacterium]
MDIFDLPLLGAVIAVFLAIWGWVKAHLISEELREVGQESAQKEFNLRHELEEARNRISYLEREIASSIQSVTGVDQVEREFKILHGLLVQEGNWYAKLSVTLGNELGMLILRHGAEGCEIAKLKVYLSVPRQEVFCMISVIQFERNTASEDTSIKPISEAFEFIRREVLSKLSRRNMSRVLHANAQHHIVH